MSTPTIYRASTDARAGHPSWLWGQPTRVTTWAFIVGFAGGAAPLGALAIITEEWAFTPRTRVQALEFAGALLGAVVVNALVWGLVVRAALSLGRALANLLLFVASGAASILVVAAIVLDGADHPPLGPSIGIISAFLLAPAFVASYGPVLRLARRVRWGASDRGPLDVAAAGCAWASVAAAIGLVLAPGPYFACCGGVSLAVALFGLHRVSRLARDEGDDGMTARSEARQTILRGMRTGALWVAILGALLVPLRLHEQRLTRNPAVIAIHKSGKAGHCDVRGAGRAGEVSLWVVDCGGNRGPLIGWDEREKVLLEGEKLRARVRSATQP